MNANSNQRKDNMKINNIHIHNFRSIQDAVISLQDYNIIVGENNVGKSNIVDALRCFYGEIRFENVDFYKNAPSDDQKAWIEIEYDLTDSEFYTLDKKYRVEYNKLKVRRTLAPQQKGLQAYTAKGLERGKFYGKRGTKPDLLGKLIYVPAVIDIKENTKLSGTSALNGLIQIMCTPPEFQQEFDKRFEPIVQFATPYIQEIGGELSNEVTSAGVRVNINTRRIFASEMIKSMLALSIEDDAGLMDLDQVGTGVQRRIIAALIKLSAKYAADALQKRSQKEHLESQIEWLMQGQNKQPAKSFMPEMHLLLFEEPEVSLHPAAIDDLTYDIKKFASIPNQQVIATTHSPQLVSQDIMDLNGIIRVNRDGANTQIFQNKIPASELQAVKNMVYFDRPRSDLFFARKVVLVEGPTEYMLYNYLCRRGDLPKTLTQNITLIETVGKWSMPYFLKVLNNYNIRHAVLYDQDGDPNRKDNQDVKNEFSTLTEYSYCWPKDIETFCGIKKQGNPAINIINKFDDGTVPKQKQDEVVQVFQDLLTKHR